MTNAVCTTKNGQMNTHLMRILEVKTVFDGPANLSWRSEQRRRKFIKSHRTILSQLAPDDTDDGSGDGSFLSVTR